MSKAMEKMCQVVIKAIREEGAGFSFNKDYQGRITEVLPNDKYKVAIYGNEYTTYSACGLTFSVNDSVWVTAPQNDFSNIYISGKRQ